MYYFIDDEIYYKGKKQSPRKVELPIVRFNSNGRDAICYDNDGDLYILPIKEIFYEDEKGIVN